jgi:hypothetical protein
MSIRIIVHVEVLASDSCSRNLSWSQCLQHSSDKKSLNLARRHQIQSSLEPPPDVSSKNASHILAIYIVCWFPWRRWLVGASIMPRRIRKVQLNSAILQQYSTAISKQQAFTNCRTAERHQSCQSVHRFIDSSPAAWGVAVAGTRMRPAMAAMAMHHELSRALPQCQDSMSDWSDSDSDSSYESVEDLPWFLGWTWQRHWKPTRIQHVDI